MRSRKRCPYRALSKAVRALPMCISPVGLGAKRVLVSGMDAVVGIGVKDAFYLKGTPLAAGSKPAVGCCGQGRRRAVLGRSGIPRPWISPLGICIGNYRHCQFPVRTMP
ncbi:protein of unknown function [Candidatus Methylocalor cossyra]|uniref:Uncharacterized protein n=1 Tax=Candidatus Methylocalor cossyra TaxID=3108543 RepID=A0ABM9NHC2_9GAMM